MPTLRTSELPLPTAHKFEGTAKLYKRPIKSFQSWNLLQIRYRRAVQKHPNTMRNTIESTTQQASMKSLDVVSSRSETIAAWAGLDLEEVPLLALRLERPIGLTVVRVGGAVRLAAELGSHMYNAPFRWGLNWWRRAVRGFEQVQYVLTVGALLRGCFPEPECCGILSFTLDTGVD